MGGRAILGRLISRTGTTSTSSCNCVLCNRTFKSKTELFRDPTLRNVYSWLDKAKRKKEDVLQR